MCVTPCGSACHQLPYGRAYGGGKVYDAWAVGAYAVKKVYVARAVGAHAVKSW